MRQNNRKKSEFPASQDVLNDAYLDFVSNGTNYRVKYTDFLQNLGVTGTLSQAGNVTGTPILDIQGPDNFIRNIEDGPGIMSSVSLNNGATIAHNFIQDTSGAEVLINPTDPSPTIASLIGSQGVNVVQTEGHITISTVDEAGSTKTVIINQKSDFPEPVLNVIQLEDDREYLITNDVDLGVDKIQMGETSSIRGVDSIIITLSYQGADFMINTADTFNRISLLSLSAPNGGLVKTVDTVKGTLLMDSVIFKDCAKLGNFTGVNSGLRFTHCSISGASVVQDGFTFIGTFSTFVHETVKCDITTGILYDLGTAVFNSFLLDHVISELGASAVFLSGAIDSGNIAAGGIGNIDTSIISGTGTALNGISLSDARWFFAGNNLISDTRTSGLLSLQNNALETVIGVIGSPVLINGIWVIEGTLQTTGSTAGSIKFDTERDTHAHFIASVSIEVVGGGTVIVSAQLAINGIPVNNSKKSGTASSGSPASITIPWQAGMNNNDTVEVWVANEDSTANLVVTSAILDVT